MLLSSSLYYSRRCDTCIRNEDVLNIASEASQEISVLTIGTFYNLPLVFSHPSLCCQLGYESSKKDKICTGLFLLSQNSLPSVFIAFLGKFLICYGNQPPSACNKGSRLLLTLIWRLSLMPTINRSDEY